LITGGIPLKNQRKVVTLNAPPHTISRQFSRESRRAFVIGSSTFRSMSGFNPTLTIQALGDCQPVPQKSGGCATSKALVQLAEADAFRPALGLARREALWAIKALRDEPLPLFAAADAREGAAVPEIDEAPIALRPMTAGSEVVEDYGHIGMSLRQHPVAFLRADLKTRRITTCAEAMQARDGRWLEVAGLVLVRQRPGSAKGVMFITIEDETGIANLVVWPQVFDRFRRTVIAASMIAVRGRIPREGEVVHLVAHQLTDLSAELATVGSPGCGSHARAR
jgi:error-prone DNA polymerase